jgi:hypothetical protein
VIHGVILQTYFKLGMNLLKVHKVITFRQSAFLRKYIEFCTEKRTLAKSIFEKNQIKLMANSVFGKFLEDPCKFSKSTLCHTARQFKQLVMKPTYIGSIIIDENLIIAFNKIETANITKPYFVGFTILELSKNYMYKCYYEYFVKYLKNVKVLFSDTDSLFISFETENINKSLQSISPLMDFSNYPSDHILYDKSKQNQLGYFKNEMGSKLIAEFVGIKSKCYAIKSVDEKQYINKKLCKGVKRLSLNKYVNFKHYRNAIKNIQQVSVAMTKICSKHHEISINKLVKIAFTSFDCKRYLFPCGIHSVPYGHYKIKNNINPICHFCK